MKHTGNYITIAETEKQPGQRPGHSVMVDIRVKGQPDLTLLETMVGSLLSTLFNRAFDKDQAVFNTFILNATKRAEMADHAFETGSYTNVERKTAKIVPIREAKP